VEAEGTTAWLPSSFATAWAQQVQQERRSISKRAPVKSLAKIQNSLSPTLIDSACSWTLLYHLTIRLPLLQDEHTRHWCPRRYWCCRLLGTLGPPGSTRAGCEHGDRYCVGVRCPSDCRHGCARLFLRPRPVVLPIHHHLAGEHRLRQGEHFNLGVRTLCFPVVRCFRMTTLLSARCRGDRDRHSSNSTIANSLHLGCWRPKPCLARPVRYHAGELLWRDAPV